MKTINPELSKRLAPYLEDVRIEHVFPDGLSDGTICFSSDIIVTKASENDLLDEKQNYWKFNENTHPYCLSADTHFGEVYKAPTLEEAIEFLPSDIEGNPINISKYKTEWEIGYTTLDYPMKNMFETIYGKTLLQAIEKMLEYLLDNDLLGKN